MTDCWARPSPAVSSSTAKKATEEKLGTLAPI
jgi:hypothetical protein